MMHKTHGKKNVVVYIEPIHNPFIDESTQSSEINSPISSFSLFIFENMIYFYSNFNLLKISKKNYAFV